MTITTITSTCVFLWEAILTDWQSLEIGIVTCCTISVIVFAAAANLLVKAAEKKSRGPVMISGSRQPPTRVFMDDITITARNTVEGRGMLEYLEKLFTWTRMRFKPTKSGSLVIRRGKVEKIVFRITGHTIPTIQEKPIKCLGKWFNETMCDTESIADMMRSQTGEWLEAIERSGLPGSYKTWCYQYGLLPRVMWPLFIYDVLSNTVESLKRIISRYLRRWLNVLRSLSSLGLYSNGSKFQLPLTSLIEEYIVANVRQALMLRDSTDEQVRGTGKKTSLRKEVACRRSGEKSRRKTQAKRYNRNSDTWTIGARLHNEKPVQLCNESAT